MVLEEVISACLTDFDFSGGEGCCICHVMLEMYKAVFSFAFVYKSIKFLICKLILNVSF